MRAGCARCWAMKRNACGWNPCSQTAGSMICSRNRIVPQLAGKSTIDGREANAVEFIKDGVRVKLYFDASTHLPLKRERETADGVEETVYGDYRKIDGVMEPFSIKIKKGASELLVTIDRVEHNGAVELTAFRYPQIEGSRPLPELEPLLKALTRKPGQDRRDAGALHVPARGNRAQARRRWPDQRDRDAHLRSHSSW